MNGTDQHQHLRVSQALAVRCTASLPGLIATRTHRQRCAYRLQQVRLGVTLFIGDKASQDDIMMRADSAMYQAKSAGRNAIVFHGEEG